MKITVVTETNQETQTLLKALQLLNAQEKYDEVMAGVNENRRFEPTMQNGTTDGEQLNNAPEVETPKAKKKKVEKLTLEGNIIPSFQSYAKSHTRTKAAELLSKYGVKSVRELQESDYPQILAELAQ